MGKNLFRRMLFFTALFVSIAIQAQDVTITGKVSSAEDEELLPGVNVIIAGTSKGTTTDFDGLYSINANKGDVLHFSFVGFMDQKITVGDQTVINVSLFESAEALDEVVVTALGISRKEQSLGYAISKVDGEELAEVKSINAINSLSGKVAGVDIQQPNTGAGGSSKVTIRGNSKLLGNNQPLYVIDGVPMDNQNLGDAGQYGGQDLGDGISSINSDDIETMSVLKGPAAAALYGARASNGVILITTKSFKESGGNKFNIDFSSNMTFDNIVGEYKDVQHVYGQGIKTPPKDIGDATGMWSWGDKMNPDLEFISFDGKIRDYGIKQDHIKSFFRQGTTAQNTIAFSGGNEATNFRFSASDVKMEDIVPNSGLHRNNFSLRGNMNMWDKLRVDAKINYTRENVKNRPYLGFSGANTALALLGLPGNIDQSWLQESVVDENGDYVFWNSATRIINPYYSLYHMKNESKKDRVIGYASLTYNITDWIDVKVKSGIDTYSYNYYNYSPRTTPLAEWGEMMEINSRTTESNTEFLISAKTKIGEDFDISGSVGGNHMQYQNKSTQLLGKNQIDDGILDITNYGEFIPSHLDNRMEVNSIYGFANFGFRDFLFLDVTGRNDWSSTLPDSNNSYFYPSFTSAFVFTKAIEGMRGKFISYGKLRASYAEVGGHTDPYRTTFPYQSYPYSFNGASFTTVGTSVLPNTNLLPSRTKGYEFGLDAKLLNWRIGLDVTYYNQTTFDEIISLQVPNSTGFAAAIRNAGEINNKGWEVMVNFVPVKSDNWRWDLTFNFANNENKIVKLDEQSKTQRLAQADWISSFIQAEEGGSYGDIMGYDFKRTDDGTPIISSNGMPIRSDEQVALGNGQYKFTGGLTNTIAYKGLKFRALIQTKSGADILSMTNQRLYQYGTHIGTLEGREGWALSENEREEAGIPIEDWTATGGYLAEGVIQDGVDAEGNPQYKPNDVYVDPRDYWGNVANGHITQPFIYDASYIKLREASISYTLSDKALNSIKYIDALTFSVIGRNLWLIYSDVPNIDPESTYSITNGQGYEYGSLPQRRSFGFNINVKF